MLEFKGDYKAKLRLSDQKWWTSGFRHHDQDQLSKVFQEIVTWCIKGQTDKLEKAFGCKPDPIYKDVLFSTLKDDRSGLNIREIVATIGDIKVMKLIHEDQTSPHLYLGNALEKAIKNQI